MRPILLTLAWFALSGIRAHAEKLEEYPAYDSATNPQKILIYSKAACLRTLAPIFDPEKIIGEGLIALGQTPGLGATPTCVDEMMANWKKIFPEPVLDPDGKLIPESVQALRARRDKVVSELRCINPYDPGSPSAAAWVKRESQACEGGFVDPSLKPEKEAERAAILAELEVFYLSNLFDTKLSELAEVFYPRPVDLAARAAADKSRVEMADFLNAVDSLDDYLDLPELRKLNGQRRCLDNFKSDNLRQFCAKNGYAQSGSTDLIDQQIRKLLPDPASALLKFKNDIFQRMDKVRAKSDARRHDDALKYGLRRLLAQQHAFALKNPAATLEAFCAANETQQRADQDFWKQTKKSRLFQETKEWKWASQYGLTESELTAVKTYTGSFYREINPSIWKAKAAASPIPLSGGDKLFVEKLNQALDRAPPFTAKPVRRFSRLPEEMLAAHAVGNIVTYDAFTSTSAQDNWRWSFSGAKAHSFLIYGGKNGIDIRDISNNLGEDEILFKAGTRFKVLSRREKEPESGVYEFVLAEVDETGNVIADVKGAK